VTILPQRPVTPDRPVVHRLERGKRFKRIKDRRVFIAEAENPDAVLLRVRGTRELRLVRREQLERDFVHVVLCSVCGRHHDVRDAMPHQLGGAPRLVVERQAA
jgi:hypothetical protein